MFTWFIFLLIMSCQQYKEYLQPNHDPEVPLTTQRRLDQVVEYLEMS